MIHLREDSNIISLGIFNQKSHATTETIDHNSIRFLFYFIGHVADAIRVNVM